MRIALGQTMAQTFAAIAGSRCARPARWSGAASDAVARAASKAPAHRCSATPPPPNAPFPADHMMPRRTGGRRRDGAAGAVPERLKRAVVAFDTREAPGTIVIDTGNTELYYVLGQGRAIRYGVGVGREGFTWSGVQTVTPQGGMAGLASAGGDDRAPALSAALHGGRSRQSAGRARDVSRLQRLPHPRHQRSLDHRQVRLLAAASA